MSRFTESDKNTYLLKPHRRYKVKLSPLISSSRCSQSAERGQKELTGESSKLQSMLHSESTDTILVTDYLLIYKEEQHWSHMQSVVNAQSKSRYCFAFQMYLFYSVPTVLLSTRSLLWLVGRRYNMLGLQFIYRLQFV